MNENAQKWIEALRSDEFAQAKGRLRRDDGFCCLGVACEVYRRETGKGLWDGNVFVLPDFDARVETHPPAAVIEWVALATDTGDVKLLNAKPLTDRNDRGDSFAEIADYIETEPEGLFA